MSSACASANVCTDKFSEIDSSACASKKTWDGWSNSSPSGSATSSVVRVSVGRVSGVRVSFGSSDRIVSETTISAERPERTRS